MAGDDTVLIKLNVVGQDSREIHFRVKQTTQMGKLKKSYSERVGVPSTSLRFVFDGRHINNDETPKTLEMKLEEFIGVYKEGTGCDQNKVRDDKLLKMRQSRLKQTALKKKSDQEEFSWRCGCCPVGLVTYPKSIQDFLSSESYNHGPFQDNFEMFLKMCEDEKGNETSLKNKHEQRFAFASRIATAERENLSYLTIVHWYVSCHANPDFKWVDDLFEGFDEAQNLISHFQELAKYIYNSTENGVDINKKLIVSAYCWVVEQLDLALAEFKQFREGLEKEREKWDKLVNKYSEGMIFMSTSNRKSIVKEIKDIIARYKNKNTDIDSLVESIQGKSVGTVPKKRKEKSSKGSQKRKIPDTKCKDYHTNAESLAQGSGSSQEFFVKFTDPIKTEHPKLDLSPIKFHKEKQNVTSADSTEEVDGLLKSKEAVSASCTEITGDVGNTKRTVPDRRQILADKKTVSESTGIVDELRKVKETVPDSTKLTDELRKTVEAFNIIKDQLDETKTLLREEEEKNSKLNDKLTSSYQEIDKMRSKILPKDEANEAKTQLREEVLNNSQLDAKLTAANQENNLLRFKILQNKFKKSRDILRLRLKNNLSVIDHLRASPDLDHTPQVQLALSSLHEFSARLLLAEQDLTSQYAAMSQTSNIVEEFEFDISGVEPPELGSAYLNLLHRGVLINQPSTPTCPSPSSSRLLSGLAASTSRDGTRNSQVEGPIFSRMALAGNQGPSLADQVDGPSSHHEEELSLVQRGASLNSSRQGSGLGFSRQGDNSNFSSQGPGPDVNRSLQNTCPVDTFLSNGATATHCPTGGATATHCPTGGAAATHCPTGGAAAFSFHQTGDTSSSFVQPGATATTFVQAGATATTFVQAGATATTFVQAGATATTFNQAEASISSHRPTVAEKLPNTKKAKKLVRLMKGCGGGASINLKDDDCSICFEEMHESDSFYLKTCWHRFHRDCINQWMESPREVGTNTTKKSTCPMCRTDIIEEDKSYKLVTKRRR